MWKLIWKLVMILICGYLVMKWLPISHPFRFEEFIIGIIIHPLEFFAASIAFYIGLAINTQLLYEVLQKTRKAIRKQTSWNSTIFFAYPGLILIYYFILQNG
ncbi:hypothetical protein ACWM35_05145 [Neobacillus sp. K501]